MTFLTTTDDVMRSEYLKVIQVHAVHENNKATFLGQDLTTWFAFSLPFSNHPLKYNQHI